MNTKIEQIYLDLEKIKQSPVLSIYLNTFPANDVWKIRLKNGLKKMQEYIAISEPKSENLLKSICKKVELKIRDHQTSLGRSIICFASEKHLFLYVLHIPVENDFKWDIGPATKQLNHLIQTYPKSGVIILQNNLITLISTELGELINETQFSFQLDRDHWKQYKGVSHHPQRAGGAIHRDLIDKRFKENLFRWYRSVIPQIEQYARRYQWQDIYLAGPPELTAEIKKRLNRRVTNEINRNFANESATTILEKMILKIS